MSYISLTGFSRKSNCLPGKTPKRNVFRNSRIVHKLRNGITTQDLQQLAHRDSRPLKTQPSLHSKAPSVLARLHDDDARSQKSLCSVSSLRSVKSNSIYSAGQLDKHNRLVSINASRRTLGLNDEDTNNLPIADLQKKLDSLLQQKIRALLMKNNKNKLVPKKVSEFDHLCDRIKREKFNKDIERLISAIESKKISELDSGDKSYDNWKMLDSKIQLLEKIIAENTTELEIMKNYFSIFSNSRTAYKAMCTPVLKKSNKLSLFEAVVRTPRMRMEDSIGSSKPLRAKLPLASTNKAEYPKPNQGDYEKYRFKHPLYEQMNRHIPHSSYQESYRKYPHIRQHSMYNQRDHLSKLGHSPFKDGSSYRDNFKHCSTKLDNYKQLDCFKDKFRDLKIKYFIKPVSPNPQINHQIAMLQRQSNKIPRLERLNSQPTQHMPLHSTSKLTHTRIDDIDRRIFKTQPKNNRLQLLKSDYRLLVNS